MMPVRPAGVPSMYGRSSGQATGQHQHCRDHEREAIRSHDRMLIDRDQCRAEEGDERDAGTERRRARPARPPLTSCQPRRRSSEDVRARREARHRDEQRVALVEPAARAEVRRSSSIEA